MIAGFALASRAWRKVGWKRVLSAVMLVLGAELAVGAAAAALLGCRVGWSC